MIATTTISSRSVNPDGRERFGIGGSERAADGRWCYERENCITIGARLGKEKEVKGDAVWDTPNRNIRMGRCAVSELVRFSVSLESDLLGRFDKFCEAGQFETRSEAVRQLIRERLTAQAVASDAVDVAASLTLVYDHHKTRLTDRMLDVQHDHTDRVVSSMHVHLTHALCMEVIVLRGPAAELQKLAAELSGMKGVHQAQLVIIRADDEADGGAHDHGGGHRHAHPH